MPYLDGLPIATVANAGDTIPLAQGGTGVPGSATQTQISVANLITAPVAAETARAEGAEGVLATAIAAEATRAEAAEGTLTTAAAAAQTTANAALPALGTTTNNNAAAGHIGEFISATVLAGSSVGLTTTTPADVTSISLTAGDWDVWGTVAFNPAGGTVTSQAAAWISTTSHTIPTQPNAGAYINLPIASTGGSAPTLPTGTTRLSLASTTMVYLSCYSVFTTSTLGAYGFIGARRVR